MAAPRQRGAMVGPTAVVFSAVLHGLIVIVGVALLHAGWGSNRVPEATPVVPPPSEPSVRTIDIELPQFHMQEPKPASSAVPALAPTHVSSLPSGTDVPRPDSERRGRGGTNESSQPGVNLADHDNGMRLVRSVASHIDRDQIPRVLSDSIRRSWENQRLTTKPMELTFLASGKGTRQERREPADRDPSAGHMRSLPASVKGAEREGAAVMPPGYDHPEQPPGGERVGSEHEAIGTGVNDTAVGRDHRTSANVAYARPMVDKGDPSVPSPVAGSPRDNVDAAQQVAHHQQSLVDTSTGGGNPGSGPGGQDGPGATGYGGSNGPGSRSQPMGYGPGGNGWNGKDPRLNMYWRHVQAKIFPLWEHAFPKWAALEMLQGRVIIEVTILPDGSLSSAQIKRPSGIAEFDQNCLKAVQRAAPFDPFPRNFPLTMLRRELSFDSPNPVVR